MSSTIFIPAAPRAVLQRALHRARETGQAAIAAGIAQALRESNGRSKLTRLREDLGSSDPALTTADFVTGLRAALAEPAKPTPAKRTRESAGRRLSTDAFVAGLRRLPPYNPQPHGYPQ